MIALIPHTIPPSETLQGTEQYEGPITHPSQTRQVRSHFKSDLSSQSAADRSCDHGLFRKRDVTR